MTEKRTYEPAKLRKARMDSSVFSSGKKDSLVRKRIEEIVSLEAPITEELLTKRLLNSFDIFRAGSSIEEHLQSVLRAMVGNGTIKRREECGIPVYRTDGETDFFRTHTGTAQGERYSYQTPPSEAAACIRFIRENGGDNLAEDELLERFKHEFGWKKAGSRVTVLFENALSLLS